VKALNNTRRQEAFDVFIARESSQFERLAMKANDIISQETERVVHRANSISDRDRERERARKKTREKKRERERARKRNADSV
jgi:hypothetical protein